MMVPADELVGAVAFSSMIVRPEDCHSFSDFQESG